MEEWLHAGCYVHFSFSRREFRSIFAFSTLLFLPQCEWDSLRPVLYYFLIARTPSSSSVITNSAIDIEIYWILIITTKPCLSERRGRSTEKNWSLLNFTKVSHKRSQVDGEIYCAFIHIQHTLKCKESLQRQNKKIIKVQRRRRQWRTGISYSREHRARAEKKERRNEEKKFNAFILRGVVVYQGIFRFMDCDLARRFYDVFLALGHRQQLVDRKEINSRRSEVNSRALGPAKISQLFFMTDTLDMFTWVGSYCILWASKLSRVAFANSLYVVQLLLLLLGSTFKEFLSRCIVVTHLRASSTLSHRICGRWERNFTRVNSTSHGNGKTFLSFWSHMDCKVDEKRFRFSYDQRLI